MRDRLRAIEFPMDIIDQISWMDNRWSYICINEPNLASSVSRIKHSLFIVYYQIFNTVLYFS